MPKISFGFKLQRNAFTECILAVENPMKHIAIVEIFELN